MPSPYVLSNRHHDAGRRCRSTGTPIVGSLLFYAQVNPANHVLRTRAYACLTLWKWHAASVKERERSGERKHWSGRKLNSPRETQGEREREGGGEKEKRERESNRGTALWPKKVSDDMEKKRERPFDAVRPCFLLVHDIAIALSSFQSFFFFFSFFYQSHPLLSQTLSVLLVSLLRTCDSLTGMLLLSLRFAIMSMRCNLLYKERHVWLKTSLHWRRKYAEFFYLDEMESKEYGYRCK